MREDAACREADHGGARGVRAEALRAAMQEAGIRRALRLAHAHDACARGPGVGNGGDPRERARARTEGAAYERDGVLCWHEGIGGGGGMFVLGWRGGTIVQFEGLIGLEFEPVLAGG
jgi:hypothetical protein